MEKLTNSVNLDKNPKTGKNPLSPKLVFLLGLLDCQKKPQDLCPLPIADTIYWGNMACVADICHTQHGNESWYSPAET